MDHEQLAALERGMQTVHEVAEAQNINHALRIADYASAGLKPDPETVEAFKRTRRDIPYSHTVAMNLAALRRGIEIERARKIENAVAEARELLARYEIA